MSSIAAFALLTGSLLIALEIAIFFSCAFP